jgi:AbiV family abortive infection protein
VKAIKDICQLADSEFFENVSEGMGLVLNHAQKLFASAKALTTTDEPAAEVLAAVAEEEAAKYLILLDAVRCPRNPSDRLSRQLGRFNEHLAKGLYARAYEMAPSSLGELQTYIDSYRADFYLDGPNDVDWIFPNEILHRREAIFYVDYVVTDDTKEWLDPRGYEGRITMGPHEPRSLSISQALDSTGVSTPAALAIVAGIWRSATVTSKTPWSELLMLIQETMDELKKGEPLGPSISTLVREWQFPMYDLDLSKNFVDQKVLRQRQARWSLEL